MKRAPTIVLAAALWQATTAFAQSAGAPALQELLARPDSREKVAALNDLSHRLGRNDPDSSLMIARLAAGSAWHIQDSLGLSSAYRKIGMAHLRLGHPSDSALHYLRLGMAISRRLDDPGGLISSAQKIADVQEQKGELDEAMDMLITALQICRSSGDREEEARTLNKMGVLYGKLGRMEQALECLFTSLNIRKDLGRDADRLLTQINVAQLYMDFKRYDKAREQAVECLHLANTLGSRADAGTCHTLISAIDINLGDHRSAHAHADTAMLIFRAIGNPQREASAMLNRAKALRSLQAPDSAEKDLRRCIALYDSLDSPLKASTARCMLAELLLDRNDFGGASAAAEEALELTRGDAASSSEHLAALKLLADVRKRQGRIDEALELYHRYQDAYSRRLNEAATGQLATAEMREKYDTELRIKEIEELKVKNALEVEQRERRTIQLYAVLVAAVLLASLALVLWRNMQHIKRLRAQEKELHDQRVNDLMRQQELRSMDAMMQGQERERERVAKDLHDRLGSMLSAIKLQFSALESRIVQMEAGQREQYNRVFNLLDDAVSEVRRISHDMVRGTLARFGLEGALNDLRDALEVPGKLKVEMNTFGLDKRLEPKLEVAIYRMVQEMVSNALKHAHPDQLSVQVTRSVSAVNLIVEDNGRGFDPNSAREGMGMGNIRARAAEFNGVVNVDSRPGRGTSISIDIPMG